MIRRKCRVALAPGGRCFALCMTLRVYGLQDGLFHDDEVQIFVEGAA